MFSVSSDLHLQVWRVFEPFEFWIVTVWRLLETEQKKESDNEKLFRITVKFCSRSPRNICKQEQSSQDCKSCQMSFMLLLRKIQYLLPPQHLMKINLDFPLDQFALLQKEDGSGLLQLFKWFSRYIGGGGWRKQVNQLYRYSSRLQGERSHKDKLFDDCFQVIALHTFYWLHWRTVRLNPRQVYWKPFIFEYLKNVEFCQ